MPVIVLGSFLGTRRSAIGLISPIPRSLWESFSLIPVYKVVSSTPVTNLELRCEAKQTKRTINN